MKKKLPFFRPMKRRIFTSQPLDLVQMDVKYVAGEQGARLYQYSIIDVKSQLIYLKIFKTKDSLNAIKTISETEVYLNQKIKAVQTDNGPEFRGEFHWWLIAQGKKHYFIPKASPYWNCYVERLHKTIDDEYYLNPRRSWLDVFSWMKWYKKERPHLTIHGKTPKQYLKEFLQAVENPKSSKTNIQASFQTVTT